MLTEDNGCKGWSLYDTTGTGVTGWGGSNPSRIGDSTITFYILQNGFTTGYLITLTTVAGNITAFTITDPAGVVTDWFDTLTSVTAFTANATVAFSITPEMIGLSADDNFVADGYYFEENITINGTTYTVDADQLIVCAHCCCMQKASASLKNCGCQDKRGQDLMWATVLTDSAIIAMNNSDVQKSVDMLDEAKKICGGGCNCQ